MTASRATPAVAAATGLLRRPAGIAAMAKAFELASLVLLVTVVPRVLGPDDYGAFAVAMSIMTIGSVTLALGGPVTMARFIAGAPEDERAAVARALAVRTARWRAALFGLFALGALVLGKVIPGADRVGLLILLVALACDAAATVLLQMTLGLGRPGAFSFRYPAQNLALIVAVVIFGPLAGTEGILVAIALSTFVGLGVGIASAGRHVGSGPRHAELPDEVSRFAFLQGVGSGALVLSQRVGIIVVAVVGSAAQTGFAGLATGIALALAFTGVQPVVAELPRLVLLGDPSAAERSLRRLGSVSLAWTGGAALVAALLAGPILEVALGSEFEGAADALQVALGVAPFAAALALLSVASSLRLRPGVRAACIAAGGAAAIVTMAFVEADAVGSSYALVAAGAVTAVTAAASMPSVVTPAHLLASVLACAAILVVGATL